MIISLPVDFGANIPKSVTFHFLYTFKNPYSRFITCVGGGGGGNSVRLLRSARAKDERGKKESYVLRGADKRQFLLIAIDQDF